jgi:hypothetical protein
LATELLRAVEAAHGAAARDCLAASSLDFWRTSCADPAGPEHELWELLGRLPRDDQLRFAVEFQLDARKPQTSASFAA